MRSTLFVRHREHMVILASILILLSVAVIVAMFVRSRAKEGVGVFEITDKDKADFKEARRELGVRRILARLAGGFGSIFFIGGVITLFQSRANWGVSVVMIAIGLFLAFCTALLVKASR
jgi:hypothetical protein